MVSKRPSLPENRNPLIEPEHTPQLEILVERRRLGQTDLTAKHGQVGLANATQPENLGVFDYAHLRVPLPSDLEGSGIFTPGKGANGNAFPESYFLMRRSSDGYISATGMFKAAYPWASIEEEQTEREHHKKVPTGDTNEVAGNVWISPEDALSLADEYGLRTWIIALLDPEPIQKGSKDRKNDIATPPRFEVPKSMPTTAASTRRRRDLRSASPSKMPPPTQSGRKIASPRKRRGRPPVVKPEENETTEDGVTPSSSMAPESVNGETVTVETDQRVEREGNEEITHTDVKITMPANSPDLPLPNNPEEMVATAQRMVEEANKLDRRGAKKALKRKADEIEDEDENETGSLPAKKVRLLEEELKKQKVKNRALMGITATMAIGAVFPFVAPYFTFVWPL